ncbi:hypothetical protein HY994_00055 [Candidatus Micrarchaeota archaeon]|nr:hypothetical protein [Candidatus Micrarchaeota archaeon]
MDVLILYDNPSLKPLADAIAQGAKELKTTVTIKTVAEKPNLAGVDFVFVGGVLDGKLSTQNYLTQQNWSKTKMALFCVKKTTGSLDTLVQALAEKGAKIEKNTFSTKLAGPLAFVGIGKLPESDLIRARGFGERTLNVAFDLGIGRNTEKSDKITGYLK